MEQLKEYYRHFAYPEFLWLLLLVPLLVVLYVLEHNRQYPEMKISSVGVLHAIGSSAKHYFFHVAFGLRMLALALLILALARPQSSSSSRSVNSEGIDIVMALDISASMLAQDLKPDRLKAAKDVASEFIDERPNDRIGLVIFSGESFTQCPLTTDHAVIKEMFGSIHTGMIEDGTAIGQGLGNAVSRIKDSEAKSKVVILLTDGVNNTGNIAPLTAAEIAKKFNVRVYTIGVGKKGKAYSPVAIDAFGNYQFDYVDVKIDEEVLEKIADMTGGKYFRATDNKSLREIYHEIDRMEKTIFEERNYTKKAEEFLPFVIIAGALLLLEFILKNTYLKKVP
ncbi:MAG TPA: VWA domain-containing protein [Bacteroidia bacterium]|jgi:Ca-activated chloride channel family protein